MGKPEAKHPFVAIMDSISEVAGEVTYASLKIAELDTALELPVSTLTRPLSEGKDGESTSQMVVETATRSPELNVWIRTRNDARDRLVKYSKIALTAGVDERMIKVTEAQADAIAMAVFGVLEDLGIANSTKTLGIVRQRLTAIDSSIVIDGTAVEVRR